MKRGMGGGRGEEGENEAAADESETRTPDAGKSQLGLRSPVTTSSASRPPAHTHARTHAPRSDFAAAPGVRAERTCPARARLALLRAVALARATSALLPAFPSRHSA